LSMCGPNLLDILQTFAPGTRAMVNQTRKYRSGELLFGQLDEDERMFVIKRGMIRAFYTAPSGREITLAYWQTGDIAGADRIFRGGPFRWSCQAITATEVYVLRSGDVLKLVASVPEFATTIVEALSFKLQWLSSLIQLLGTQSVKNRLAYLLDRLCELYGVPGEKSTVIGVSLTHEDLAMMVGASRQWVTMALDAFQDRGIARLRRQHIEILRRDLLIKEE
jgi:CRP/FNR family cyclic AMP-dependent transcriptional regulator